MKPNLLSLAIGATLLFASPSLAGETGSLAPELEPLRPLLGKTWRAEFPNSTPEKPVVDIMRWERVLNGKAVRHLHSINDGVYGGESIYRWDPEKKTLTYHYFTTAGFMTAGTMTIKDNKFITHEVVTGDTGGAGGVKEVRSTSEMLPDGTFRIRTENLKDGEWKLGRETIYKEAAGAKIVFK